MTLRVLILHNAVPDDATAAEADVLVQASVVDDACRQLGHATERLGCTLDLSALADHLANRPPDVVFNLVESLGGSDRLASLVPAFLAAQRISFTGSPHSTLDLTNEKPQAKEHLLANSLPTAPWLESRGKELSADLKFPGRYILKAIWEHASVGIDDSAIVTASSRAELQAALAKRARKFRGGVFAEEFIAGREFNVSLLAGADGPQVLPPAEIDFSRFPADKLRIVGYDAKWSENSFEFVHTPRRFDFAAADQPLLRHLAYLARRCWSAFDIRGYARVDFRVDEAGRPWILEINANPCLSPDAGYAAALQQAGISFPAAIQRILDDALPGLTPGEKQSVPPRRHEPTNATRTGSQTVAPQTATASNITFRTEVVPSDPLAVRQIVAATGKFRPAEVEVAVELVDERLQKGPTSGYEFVFAEQDGKVVGYACFGRITVTVASYDVYWIAVDPRAQARGLGKAILSRAEEAIWGAGGQRIFIETSGRPDYWATRAFYEACGYRQESRVADFYAPGDDKVLYGKSLVGAGQ